MSMFTDMGNVSAIGLCNKCSCCQLLWCSFASILKLGERGQDFEITSDIEMSVYFTDTGIAGLHREEGHVPLAAPEEHVIAAAASHDDETQGDQDLYKHLGRTWGAFGESSSYDCFVVKDMFCISCRTECLQYVSCLRSP